MLAGLLAIGITWWIAHGAHAAAYSDPFWSNNSSSPETAIPMIASLAMTEEGVDARTGELFWHHHLFTTPGVLGENVFGLTWRSMVSGRTQFGRGWIPSWEITAEYVLINAGDPDGNGGHAVDVRRPTGRIDRFLWDGSAYGGPDDVTDTLTTDVSGDYVLSDKHGNEWQFDSNGMLDIFEDRNGNQTDYDRTGYKLTGWTDDRGNSYTVTVDADDYVTGITDYAGRTWTFEYDASDNLISITTPPPSGVGLGIETEFTYDGSHRLTDVTDGRGNTVWEFAYVGATGAVDDVTIDGDTVDYSYATGVTTRNDRNGNDHRIHFTGAQVTKKDMWIDSASEYATVYRYSTELLDNMVLPRGNRIDFTFDSMHNLTERRHRTTDTGTNHASDLVHEWEYNSANFATSYTDPRGNEWTFGRDSDGNLTSIDHPDVTDPATQTASQSRTYNAKGQLATFTDEEGRLTRLTYGTTGTPRTC